MNRCWNLQTVTLATVTCLTLGMPVGAAAQGGAPQPADTTVHSRQSPVRLTPVIVTATRTPKEVFTTATPATVIDQREIRELAPNSASDLLKNEPGLDVNGVGPNQERPTIRGQRGQRILLLQDGMRLTNSRRQQDFGEIPALTDINAIERVEIVRGPASVLYGSDAIGGVINLITITPERNGIHGTAGVRYSDYDNQRQGNARLMGRVGQWSFAAGGTLRRADAYDAPGGTFGGITLAGDTPVHDTGIEDGSLDGYLAFEPTAAQRVSFKYERYRADTAGFGFVDPAAFAPGSPDIQIRYPKQDFDRYAGSYHAGQLGFALADRVDVSAYLQKNVRRFNLDVFVPFGPGTPPGAGVQSVSTNFTDLTTVGGRVEVSKLAAPRVVLTYGLDVFNDHSDNTDSSATTILGFGPPMTDISTVPQVPNATFRSAGAFFQGDVQVTNRLDLILGTRYQDVRAHTRTTPGISDPLATSTNRTVVGSANANYRLGDNLSLIASVGRAFRSPNLVERFFNGPTPEGAGYQVRNPDLKPETSINVDLGARYRDRRVYLEAFAFRNAIHDGIRIAPTGDTIIGLPAFQDVNVDKLRFQGVEVNGDLQLPVGFSVGGNYSYINSKDVLNPNNPIGDSYSSKIVGHVRYDYGSRFWAEYNVRHNGERKDVQLVDNPVGSVLPPFTVHSARAGVTVFNRGGVRQELEVAVVNLTNTLYAEFSNVSFFRPAPKRGVVLTWDVSF